MGELIYEIEKELKFLPPDKIKEVRDFIKFLLSQTKHETDFSKLFGSIQKSEGDLMKESIENACEKINYEEW